MQDTHAQPVRCLLGMLGTDIHSKGIRTLARWLRDRGTEVIYLGENNTVEGLVSAAAQEDADVVGLSFSSGSYLAYTERVVNLMRERGLGDIAVIVGGQIHPDDVDKLLAMGVARTFGPGTTKDEALDCILQVARKRVA